MSKKSPHPAPRKSSGNGKIFFGILLVVAVAVGGFAIAEHSGLTGTHVFFKDTAQEGETGADLSSATAQGGGKQDTPRERKGADATTRGAKKSSANDKKSRASKSEAKDEGKSASPKKKSSAGTAAAGAETIPDFATISRQNHTWPTFLKLTRSRNISISDPKTGISMGHMDIPAGTIVKVSNVLPNGTIVVFDRTGQVFQVSASGTNFTEAYLAKKNKPKKPTVAKKKTEAKKTAATTASPTPARQQATQKQTSATPPASSSGSAPKRVSAFGVFDASDWDDEDND